MSLKLVVVAALLAVNHLLWRENEMGVNCMRVPRSTTDKLVYEMYKDPEWPLAYQKYTGQTLERKGRTSSSMQDFRDECQTKGGRSKCHIGETIDCGNEGGGETCHLQIQGADTAYIPLNIPTVTDTPWAVGGSHRNDFAGSGTTHACVMLSGGGCIEPEPAMTDFSSCSVRCWGHGTGNPPTKTPHVQTVHHEIGPNMDDVVDHSVFDYTATDSWSWPSEDEDFSSSNVASPPLFNPQGYVLTLAGGNGAGFVDGPPTEARFHSPEGITVATDGTVYVADSKNHAIRSISSARVTATVVGDGTAGWADGPVSSAHFSHPTGIAWFNHQNGPKGALLVADRDNHRIRLVNLDEGTVSCLAGRCGVGTESKTESLAPTTPGPGYADGSGDVARFDGPSGIAITSDGKMAYIADTNNHLLRGINISSLLGSEGVSELSPSSTTLVFTVAGTVEPSEPGFEGGLESCPPPCMHGVPGHRDGNLTFAKFVNPIAVAVEEGNGAVIVTQPHSLRRVDLAEIVTEVESREVSRTGTVSTLAGDGVFPGVLDGNGTEASFTTPSGVVSASDGEIFVADVGSCRIRRVLPVEHSSQEVSSCSATLTSLLRPRGCSSYDPPVDNFVRTASSLSGNINYNHRFQQSKMGFVIHDCLGSPPMDELHRTPVGPGFELAVGMNVSSLTENTELGTTIAVICPSGCSWEAGEVRGGEGGIYSDDSAVCGAAVHSNSILSSEGGFVLLTLLPGVNTSVGGGLSGNAVVESEPIPSGGHPRMFSVEPLSRSQLSVQTISGGFNTTTGLDPFCGYLDGQPPQKALFSEPRGLVISSAGALGVDNLLLIADSGNNAIRAASFSMCTFPCENGGTCSGHDTCSCTSGWKGVDCTIPDCSGSPCGSREICIAPNTCSCIPGYQGIDCNVPQCAMECLNGGSCSVPDVCTCPLGWFGPDCGVPLCTQTCGNGGNCTSPDTCSCPTDWQGEDCRTPVCSQECMNGGMCIAPHTCACPPTWSGPSCTVPVCHQGFFRAYSDVGSTLHEFYAPCNYTKWCEDTNTFDCNQTRKDIKPAAVGWGISERARTGRSVAPDGPCMMIELSLDVITLFSYLISVHNDSITSSARYSVSTPFPVESASPGPGLTGPFNSSPDRQVAMVELLSAKAGHYVCANGGGCIEPGVCACATGWSGFDCRTPVCTQGYWDPLQPTFVSSNGNPDEVPVFEASGFLDPSGYRMTPPYSNPTFTTVMERFVSVSDMLRESVQNGGVPYLNIGGTRQGGYRCSVRAYTAYESPEYLWDEPTFRSQFVSSDMEWPPTHEFTAPLKFTDDHGITYIYTDKGYKVEGIWKPSGIEWQPGVCLLEFERRCFTDENNDSVSPPIDLASGLTHVRVLDPDLSYRSRVTYDNWKETSLGRWIMEDDGVTCIDVVIRGCKNNGTCLSPDLCECRDGWSGSDCSIPICVNGCHNGGTCTLPGICTCAKGWSGEGCSIPLCAQECNNGGECVAPDVCKCKQWESTWVDGREGVGLPLFQKPSGDPQLTGWTGYDCSIPICTQADAFLENVEDESAVSLGGHGADNLLACDTVRCPQYNLPVVMNDGKSFQTGCGWDPLDTGCCYVIPDGDWRCSVCDDLNRHISESNFTCTAMPVVTDYVDIASIPDFFLQPDTATPRICGHNHSPIPYFKDTTIGRDNALYSSRNDESTYVGSRYLCGVHKWEQGDYNGYLELGENTGMGTDYPLEVGRHIRINSPNYIQVNESHGWIAGPIVRGEGVYACANNGSCIGPDTCTCADGWGGFDCRNPICRQLQPSGVISSCANGGVCINHDECHCITAESLLWKTHLGAVHGVTGWTGLDCSIPICTQGFFDPSCTDVPTVPGSEGCFRCANGGNCTAPDVCSCMPGWEGYDCHTPVCEVVADSLTRINLDTVDERKVAEFESDPCGMRVLYPPVIKDGVAYLRGNCTAPNQCTCTCFGMHDTEDCQAYDENCERPWQDPLVKYRNVLPKTYMFGTRECYRGYEGLPDEFNRFTTCHLNIFEPSWAQKQTVPIVFISAASGFLLCILYVVMKGKFKRRKQRLKALMRRRRLSLSE